MGNPCSLHWIPAHAGSLGSRQDKDIIATWNAEFIKILTDDLTIPQAHMIPPHAKIIVRNYPLSELDHNRGFADVPLRAAGDTQFAGAPWEGSGRDYMDQLPSDSFVMSPGAALQTPEAAGIDHAARCNKIAQWAEANGISRNRLWFEGLNEPELWGREPPEAVARYYRTFLIELHKYNLRGVVGNFGVGWPGNGGVAEAPVKWDFFKPVIDTMILDKNRPDYLGLHEYWFNAGPFQNWRWWGGRYEQCPFNVPILITETGSDWGVAGQPGGSWQNYPGDERARADRYIQEILDYWNRCRNDKLRRIKAIFPFTYDRGSGTWVQFDIRTEMFVQRFFERKHEFVPVDDSVIVPPPVVVPDKTEFEKAILSYAEQQQTVKINPNAALLKKIKTAGMWATTGEYNQVINGVTYVCQRGENPVTGEVIVFYVKVGDWSNIMQVKR